MKILHVVGKVGAGKSWFISKYCSDHPVFDIQSIYKNYHITPSDIRGARYWQFAGALEQTLENFCQQYADKSWVIIESSGLNRVINSFVLRFSTVILLIESSHSENIAIERPYAIKLNYLIQNALDRYELVPDYIFNGDILEFSPRIPAIFKKLSG